MEDIIIKSMLPKHDLTTPRYMKPKDIEWWRKLSPNETNMRGCPGFIDLYKRAIALPMPYDITLEYSAKRDSLRYIIPNEIKDAIKGLVALIAKHTPEQYNKAFPEFENLKIVIPWFAFGPEDHSFLMTNNFFQTKKDIHILNGVLEFHFQHSINIQSFFKKEDFRIDIKKGEPLGLLIPLKDNVKYNIHYEQVPREEILKLIIEGTPQTPGQNRWYYNRQKHEKRIDS